MVSRKPVSPPPRPKDAAHPQQIAKGAKPARRLLLRPLARAQQISLFEREVRERLSRAGLDLVFAAAKVMSEGQRTTKPGKDAFFGSTMLTIDLGAVAASVRDACDARSAERLATLLADDTGAHARVQAIAAREVERLTGTRPSAITVELSARAQGATLFVDADVEASF
jgi:hypothetical protein